MENHALEQAEIEVDLGRIPDLKLTALKPFFKSLSSHFFKIRYTPGEIIMPRGVQSDFAGFLRQGCVEVHDHRIAPPPGRARPEKCWNRPGLLVHRLERWTLDQTDRLDALDPEDAPASSSRRKRALRAVARRLRSGLQRLEDWAIDRADRARKAGRNHWQTRAQGWIAENVLGWARRRALERRLSRPLEVDAAGRATVGSPIARIEVLDEQGNEQPFMPRFMGLTGALWNVPRSVTLIAQPDRAGRPCELLIVKRDVLLKIEELSESFRRQTTDRFLDTELAPLLLENRLFRNTFAESDVTDWPGLRDLLRGKGAARHPEALRRIRRRMMAVSTDFPRWLEESLEADGEVRSRALLRSRYQIVGALNAVLKRRDLDSPYAWPEPGEEARSLRDLTFRSDAETIRLNHLLVCQGLGEVLRADESVEAGRWPLRVDQFQQLIDGLRAPRSGARIALLHYEQGERIYAEGELASDLYLIVSGTVTVTRRGPGGEVLVNQLDRHGYFGVSAIEVGARHSATIRAVTPVNAVALDRAALRHLMNVYPAVARKLGAERMRLRRRDEMISALDRLPPAEPTEEIASRLLVAGNLLRIDMDRCTRCDQCVRACGEAHDGIPRFVRANPALRFGHWEVAASCVHCREAPCQSACPVGAIAFLDDGTVQVHRARCIGCEQCVPACPFNVIAMELPPANQDIATNTISGLVATKCDLCLDAGGDPPCVASCPYGAAERGTPRALFPEIKSWADVRSTH
jgi:Fe-S-cluster-containing dehydrogenase component